ncbi:MAG: helix-turn-helix domain-containing protein [Bdellovibrionales bacterium]|nr:helix-turn-helix domain-containing protein [Bdellovibrionales bacterium]
MVENSIGLKLAMIAKSKGFTQKQIAEKCGLSRITIHRYFNGKTDLRSHEMVKVLKILGIDVEQELQHVIEGSLTGVSVKKSSIYNDISLVLQNLDEQTQKTLMEQISWWGQANTNIKEHKSLQRISEYIQELKRAQ